MLTEQGEINVYHTYMRTGVVDVGTYTVDIGPGAELLRFAIELGTCKARRVHREQLRRV